MFRSFLIALSFIYISTAVGQIDCRCCKTRSDGQTLFNQGRYAEAKTKWQTAKEFSDSATNCSDLDALIAKAKKKVNDAVALAAETPRVEAERRRLEQQKNFFLIFNYQMVPVKGGVFTMGSNGHSIDECQHTVSVASFNIGQTEVTQDQWEAVMDSNPSHFKGAKLPVENVNWNDVQTFIKKLNEKAGKNFRLPTEGEWEYAARGANRSGSYKYAGSNNLDEVAWYTKTTNDKGTQQVGTKKANELGIYDMSGNVWEWCQDNWAPYPGCKEPKETDYTRRVLRGGAWNLNDYNCLSANRHNDIPLNRHYGVGFRLAQD